MATRTVTTPTSQRNHIRYEYDVDKIFLNYPNQQKSLSIANATGADVTIAAGTLVGITTADQDVGMALASAANDGSEIPYGFVLEDTVIPATDSADVLIGWGDDKSSIYEDKVVLDGTDTLDTVITQLGISIRNAVSAYTQIKIEPTAQNISLPKDSQI